MAFRTAIAALAVFLALALPARAECREARFAGKDYTVCSFDPAQTSLELFNLDDAGEPLQSFSALSSVLEA